MNIQYRWATASDYDALGDVMFDAVRNGPSRYSEAHRAAWVEAPRQGAEWNEKLAKQSVAVAHIADEIIGLMSLASDGYLDFAYIRPAHQGTGVFRKLYAMILQLAEEQKQPRILVHASLMAQPAFSAMGFEIIKKETVALNGLDFERFEMQLLLAK
jgi:putative acetyltransferase